MEGSTIRLEVEDRLQKMPAGQKMEILRDLVYLYRTEETISADDWCFLKRVARKLQIDKSMIDLMLK